MSDFATLIMTADASGLKQGEQALDSLASHGEQAERRVTDAMSKTGKSAQQLGGAISDVVVPFRKLPGETDKAAGGFARLGPQVQNASYQVGDFFVQIASGQSATIALAQQLPQLLGGFGVFGAMAGAGVAIGGALVPMMFDMKDGADQLEDALDELSAAQDAVTRSFEIVTAPMAELIDKYGEGAGRVREMALMQMQLNVASAKSTLADTVSELSDATERYTSVSGVFYSQTANALDAIENDFGLTGDAAWEFIGRMKDLEKQTDRNLQVQQFRDLVDWLEAAGVEIEDMPPEMARAAAAMLEVNISAEELQALISDANIATTDATSATFSWADAMTAVRAEIGAIASALASMGGGAIANAGKFAELTALRQGRTIAEAARERQRMQMEAEFTAREAGAGSWVERMLIQGERSLAERGLEIDTDLDLARGEARERERLANKKAGAGRKGRKPAQDRLDGYERSVIDIQGETAAFLAQADAMAKVVAAGGDWERALAVIEEEQKLLNAAQKAGVELTPQVRDGIKEMAEAYVDAEDKLERIRNATEKGQDAMRDFFGSILDGVDGAKDALVQLLEQIAKVQFAKGMMGLLGQTSWGGGLVAGIGDLLSFDGGGYTGNGPRTGGLDGKGGYLAIIHPQETVSDHTKGKSAGGVNVHVTVGIDDDGNLQVRKIAQEEARSMGRAVIDGVPSQIQQYQLNPRRR